MPPRQKITREDILECAAKLVEEKGIEAVTARNVAKAVGCSIQPVFSQFTDMEVLRQATFDYVCQHAVEEILTFEKELDFFSKVSLWVIELARKKPQVYQLIYLSNHFKGNQLLDIMAEYESNQAILARMGEQYGLPMEVCKDILMRSFLFLHGIASMICVNHLEFTNEQVAAMMKQTVADMVRGAKV